MPDETRNPNEVFDQAVAWLEAEATKACDDYLKLFTDGKVEGYDLPSFRSAYAQRMSALVKSAKRQLLIGYYKHVRATTGLDLTPTVVGHALKRVTGRKVHFAVLVQEMGEKGRDATRKSSVTEKELAPYDKEAGRLLEKFLPEIERIKDQNRSRTEAAAKKAKRID